MRKELQQYYREDIDRQKMEGRKPRFFTKAGYDHLNDLIRRIKNREGDPVPAVAEFHEIIMPWVEYTMQKHPSGVSSDRIVYKAIAQIKTNPEIKDWSSFHYVFQLILQREMLNMARADNATMRYAAKLPRREAMDDPVEAFARGELQERVRAAIAEMPADERLALTRAHFLHGDKIKAPPAEDGSTNPLTSKGRRFRLKEKLRRSFASTIEVAPLLAEGVAEAVSEDNISLAQQQLDIIRNFFDFPPEMTTLDISRQLRISEDAAHWLFGGTIESADPSGALDPQVEYMLKNHLRYIGKPERVPGLGQALQTLRECFGHKAQRDGTLTR